MQLKDVYTRNDHSLSLYTAVLHYSSDKSTALLWKKKSPLRVPQSVIHEYSLSCLVKYFDKLRACRLAVFHIHPAYFLSSYFPRTQQEQKKSSSSSCRCYSPTQRLQPYFLKSQPQRVKWQFGGTQPSSICTCVFSEAMHTSQAQVIRNRENIKENRSRFISFFTFISFVPFPLSLYLTYRIRESKSPENSAISFANRRK